MKNTNENYYVAGRRTTLFALTATLVMTELNTSTLIGFSSLGYIYGQSAIALGLVFLIGLVFYALSVAKKWKSFNAISVSEYFSQRYHPLFGILVAIYLWISMLGFGANFIKSIDIFTQALLPNINPWLSSGVLCLLMLGLTIRKGLTSVIRIDCISFVLCMGVFGYLLWHTLYYPIENIPLSQAPSLPWSFTLSLIIITMFTYILSPWYGQKIFSAATPKVAFQAVIYAAVFVSIFYGIAIFVTAHYAPILSLNNSDDALAMVITSALPYGAQGIIYLTLFLIAMTTIAALWNTMASVIFAHQRRIKQQWLVVMVIAILSYLIANLWIDHILDKMLLFNIPIAALAFSLLYGFYGKKHNLIGAIASVVVGTVSALIAYLYSNDFVVYWALVCIPLSFVSGWVLGKYTTQKRHI